MIRRISTISDATHEWVREMNAIPQAMISKLMAENIDDWHEVTVPVRTDRVYFYTDTAGSGDGEIICVATENDNTVYDIELDSGGVVAAHEGEFEVIRDDTLPMWGTMWSFGDNCDEWWLEEDDGIRKMSECGFRIYYSDEFGYFFGIDGAGYDFYESHWIPLYKARDLHWHEDPINLYERSLNE